MSNYDSYKKLDVFVYFIRQLILLTDRASSPASLHEGKIKMQSRHQTMVTLFCYCDQSTE